MISVAMASFNGQKFIKRQIESILKNLSEEDELVISDDNSTDDTLKIVQSLEDKRIKIYTNPGKGVNQNFSNALLHCKGDYIFLSDQDDIWYDNKIVEVMKVFKEGNYLMVEHNAIVTDEKGKVLIPSFFEHRRVRSGVAKNIIRNTYHGCCMALNASIVNRILPMPKRGCFHDQWIGIVADYLGNVFFLDEILMEYRRYENNTSSFQQYPFHIQLKNRILLVINYLLFRVKAGFRL